MPMITLSSFGLYTLVNRNDTISRKTFFIPFFIVSLAWIVFNLATTANYWIDYRSGTLSNSALDAKKYCDIGKWLYKNAESSDVVLAYEIGGVGYYSHLKILDHEGLVEKTVAGYIHGAGGYDKLRYSDTTKATRDIVNYCAAQKPDWFLIRSSADIKFEIGSHVSEDCADEKIQNFILNKIGADMYLRKIFPMNNSGSDKYLLLERIRH